MTATHDYFKPGVYTITVTVMDDDGAFASNTLVVTVTKPKGKQTESSVGATPDSIIAQSQTDAPNITAIEAATDQILRVGSETEGEFRSYETQIDWDAKIGESAWLPLFSPFTSLRSEGQSSNITDFLVVQPASSEQRDADCAVT